MLSLKGSVSVSQLLPEHIRQVQNHLLKSFTNNNMMSKQIYDIVIAELLDQKNWNQSARYSGRSLQAGQIFDLTLSGQLLKTIVNQRFNAVGEIDDNSTSWVRIGNIEQLDSLKSKRAEYGSTGGSVRSQNAPYWRFVIFGHRPPKRNYTFIYGDGFAGKDTGAIVPGTPKMRGTPPTYAFSNSLKVAIPQINRLVEQQILDEVAYLNKLWESGTSLRYKPSYFR